jgi:hypothetical protein
VERNKNHFTGMGTFSNETVGFVLMEEILSLNCTIAPKIYILQNQKFI